MKLFSSTYNKILTGLNFVSVALIFLISLLVAADVICRYFFNSPIVGTTELVKASTVIIVFLGMPYTLKQGRHIQTTVIIDRLPPINKVWSNISASFIGLIVFGLLCYFSLQDAWASYQVREFDGDQIRVYLYPSRFCISLGGFFLFFQSLLNFLKNIAELVKNNKIPK
jgi:TRAP-type C4-dicarboxylate transport system permease small subunit